MRLLQDIETQSKNAVQSGEQLLKAKKKYYELKIFKQLVIFSSNALKIFLIGSFSLLGLLFLTTSLAFFLSELFQSSVLGFLTTGITLLALGGLLFLLRRKLERHVIQKLSETFFDEQ